MVNEPFIICDNLVKLYKVAGHEVMALQGLDLVVGAGELLGIVGVSGSGKSTLLSILGGLDRPSAGRVWVGGQDLLNLPDRQIDHYRRSTVGFVWQQSGRNLIPYLNARANVELPLTLAGWVGRKKRRRAEELLEAVELSGRKLHRLSELSGGEQQRVAIAVALANQPRLLLADEPTGEVDEATARQLYALFRKLKVEFGLTTLIVSHDPRLAHHVDRVVAIRDGKVASETVRRTAAAGDPPEQKKTFEELAVLDSSGRLQLPEAYREALNIRRRVRLELGEDAVLVRPAGEESGLPTVESLVDAMERAKETNMINKLRARWRSIRERGQDDSSH